MKTLKQMHFAELLPDSIKEDATTKALAEVLDIEFSLLMAQMDVPQFLLRVDSMIEPELSILARELCAPFWEPDVRVERKREVIKKALIWNMFRGTGWCVRDALATVYGAATMQEWHEYGGARGTFTVTVDSTEPVTADSYGQILRILAETKRQSQHLEAISIPNDCGGDIGVAAVGQMGITPTGLLPHDVGIDAAVLPVGGIAELRTTLMGLLPAPQDYDADHTLIDAGLGQMCLPCNARPYCVAETSTNTIMQHGGIGQMAMPIIATIEGTA